MGIVIRGKTKCMFCGEAIREDDEIVGVPSFLPKGNRLFKYNDATFHKQCYEKMADKDVLDKAIKLNQEIWKSRPMSLKSREEIEAWGKEAFAKLKDL